MASDRSWVTNTTVWRRASHSASSSACRLTLGVRVEGAERLVHQQDLRLDDQRAHEGDTLAYPARQRGRKRVLEAGQAGQRDGLANPALPGRARHTAVLELHGDVAGHRSPGIDGVLLEHVTDLRWRRARHGHAVDLHRARRRPHQPPDPVEDRGLAAAGQAHDGDEFLIEDLEGDVVHGGHLASAASERLGEVADDDAGALHLVTTRT
jgi:hypothetical protein